MVAAGSSRVKGPVFQTAEGKGIRAGSPARCYRTAVSLPLSDLAFSVAGPGRVGSSLAAWMEALGARQGSAGRRGGLMELSTAGQGLLLVAVPDPALAAVAAELARRPQPGGGRAPTGRRGAAR